MARLELEVGTDVLLLETGDALLLEGLFALVGTGAITIAGILNRKTLRAIGAGSITTTGALGRNIARAIGAGSISIAGSLGRLIKTAIGTGSITIAGTLGRLTKLSIGAGCIAITGALSGIRTAFQAVGSGAISIAGTLASVLTHFVGVGSGSIAIAGTLVSIYRQFASIGSGAVTIAGTLAWLIKITIGAGAITSAGSLGRKIYFYVGSGAVTIAGSLGRLIKLVVGTGSIGIVGILSHFFFIDWQKNAIIHSGSIPTPIMLVEAVTKGDALGYDNGWKKAWAKSGSVVQFRCVAAEDGSKNQTITAYFGTVLMGRRLAGGRAGRALYVEEGTGAGRYTQTKPTTVGDADTVIGYMLTGTLALIHSSLNDDSTV